MGKNYAGEPTEIYAKNPRDFNNVAFAENDIQSAFVEVWSNDYETEILPAVAMEWSAERQTMRYVWDTTGIDPGTYRSKITITIVDGFSSWEWGRIRLARDPQDA